MTILHYINDDMQTMPNFVSIYGIWMDRKVFAATLFVQLFNKNVTKKTPR